MQAQIQFQISELKSVKSSLLIITTLQSDRKHINTHTHIQNLNQTTPPTQSQKQHMKNYEHEY